MKDFIVVLGAQSMSEMGADRYWELHVKAETEEEAINKAKNHTKNWTVFNTSFDIMDPAKLPAMKGSMVYVEIPDGGDDRGQSVP